MFAGKMMSIETSSDIILVRQAVRQLAVELKFSLVEQTKIVTAASEIARNTLDHGGGGTVQVEVLEKANRQGLRLTFEDQGMGIADVDLALQDGFTTGSGLGMGLSGAKRLMNEFEIISQVGVGTKIAMTKWK
ncbi:anti-sigma regulatory factor [Chroococcus sp. FPU101]|uniref:anti-sigma regulatory factor n=1 Tax=Chroococcus sp. FPU101 TaxID=1974212 RepID=UPI001A8C5D81|nr:anti-sigma regulatory factor [Chroococcus sp. FPU101]GFE68962.1 putative anti-sigma regulatory factor, serine/threonine protein kinase [Chroococcus sp. FPU101]